MSDIETRLKDLGIGLPTPALPVANYVAFTRSGNLVHISGQLSNDANGGIRGIVGVDVSVEQATVAARLCAINLMAQMKVAAAGDLGQIAAVHKLNVFVQAGPDFTQIPAVANGASDLIVEVLGERGKHARSAIGAYKVPLGFAVEVDAVVEVMT